MTSFFRRRRRSIVADDSPPLPLALPAPPMPSSSPRWLLGSLISGAGKLISAVFRSDSEESSQRSSIYSEESSGSDSSDSSYEDDDDIMINKGANNQGTDKQLALRGYMEGSLAIVPKDDCKSVIEELLIRESFSREECDRLTKLIQSRVTDFTSTDVDNDGKQKANALIGGFTGTLQAKGQLKQLPESISPISDLRSFSMVSPIQSRSPEFRDKAITEAKRYLEEMKRQSGLISDADLGPCSFNTDVLHYGLVEETGSPVDMAKSYMQSLPPWQSPFWSTAYFKTPSPISNEHLNKAEIADDTVPLFRTLKRRYSIIDSHDLLERSRSIRQKTMELLSNSRKHIDTDQSIGADTITSHDVVHKSNGSAKEIKETDESPVLASDSAQPVTGGNGFKLSGFSPSWEINQYPLQDKEHSGSTKNHNHVAASSSMKNGADYSSEAEVKPVKKDKSTAQSYHNAADLSFSTQLRDQMLSEVNNSFHLNREIFVKKNSVPQDGSIQTVTNGSTNSSSAEGLLEKRETNSHSQLSAGKDGAGSSSTSRSSAKKGRGCHEDHNKVEAENAFVASSSAEEPIDGSTMRSIDRMLAEPKAKDRRHGRKKVVSSKRGRGRLR